MVLSLIIGLSQYTMQSSFLRLGQSYICSKGLVLQTQLAVNEFCSLIGFDKAMFYSFVAFSLQFYKYLPFI